MARTYVVTGANRGIGRELVRSLVERGERVIATARRPAAADELRALQAPAARPVLRIEELDVAEPHSVQRFARHLGDEPIDVLINNAGVGVGGETLGRIDFERLRAFYDVNALGALRVTEALLPALRRGTGKLVANMTSKMGSIADNTSGGAYAYRASKAALNALTKSLALDLAPEGFRCVVLHPGWVRTDMGGGSAPLEVGESARGLLAVLDGLQLGDSGRFLDYSGAEVPW